MTRALASPIVTLLAAPLLGVAAALGFAPIGAWPATLIVLTLWMAIVQRLPTQRSVVLRGYLFGLGHFVMALNWIAGAFAFQDTMPAYFGWFAVVLVALIVAIYPMFAALFGWYFRASRYGYPFAFAAGWIVTEWLRSVLFSGFAWDPLSVAIVDSRIAAAASVIGTYGLSGLLVLLAALPLMPMMIAKRVAVFAVIITGLAIAAIPTAPDAPLASQPLIHIVQPNIGQQDKHVDAFAVRNFAKLAALSGKPGREPRLLLWPEAAIPDYLDEADYDAADARKRIAGLLGPRDVLLTGGVKRHFARTDFGSYYSDELVGARNAVFTVDASGRLRGRYDKAHLVPGGEYLPLKPVLAAVGLTRLVPGTVDFWPGTGPRSLDVPGFGKVGVQICYEIIFSGQVIDRTNRPAVLFNPSNDAWFGRFGPPQHLAQTRLRAIEEAVPVIRSTPTGISAVIDAHGRIVKQLPNPGAGFIETRLPVAGTPTVFARFGNAVALGFAALLGVLAIALARGRR